MDESVKKNEGIRNDDIRIFFDDPRLRMTMAGRLLVRVFTWITYLVCIGAMATFLISDITRVRFAGIILALILLDLFIHRGQGDMPISELEGATEINVAATLRTGTFSVLERCFDAGIVAQHDFFLEATKRLLELPEIDEGMRRLDISTKEFKAKLDELAVAPTAGAADAPVVATTKEMYLKNVERLAVAAFGQALSARHDFIEPADLFSALPTLGDPAIDRLFNLFELRAGDIERALILTSQSLTRGIGRIPALLGGFTFATHRRVSHRIVNRAWTSRPTPLLDRYSEDFMDLARDGAIGFLVGHDNEYERLVETLARPTNPNALLVGDAGIGKEAIVQHLAFRLSKDDVPRALFDKRLVSFQLTNLVAGVTSDELNARLKAIVEEIEVADNIILYIPDIHDLVRTSGAAYISAADALMPVIMSNRFPIVGATHPKEFKEFIEPRSDFMSAFEMIQVAEISEADAEKLLTYEALILEKKSGVVISFGAIKRAVSLAKRFIRAKFLPASAEELLKSALAIAENRGDKTLGPDAVTKATETKTNIPIHEATGEEAQKLLGMEDSIHARLVGQEEAVKAVATALREYRSGLARKGGPIASFLFVGPTGVGKTELAKILADIQFGSEKMMTRFDMTEYQDKASIARLIGSADAASPTAGHGALTDAVLEKPYSLILLDEFEKAYPDILNLFLQVLDDGRLTDGLGRTVDFTNTIIIATSNAHSDIINGALAKGQSMADIADDLKKRLVDVFKPELINRFSKIIIFRNLEPAQLAQIAAHNLDEVAAALLEQNIHLDIDPTAVALLARLGYDPQFGARPLRRVIEEKIRAPLAGALLAQQITRGARVKLVAKGEEFGFE